MILKRIDLFEETERRFRGAMHVAIGLLGWLLPDSKDVADAEDSKEEIDYEDLPTELQDPLAVLDRERSGLAQGPENPADSRDVSAECSPLSLQTEKSVDSD